MRGGHAHRVCTQLLICVSGEVEVSVDDGQRSSNYLLDDPRTGLLIGPLLWSQQIYLHAESTLLVLADEPYDEREYIRSRDDFERLVQPNRESKESFDP
jgi:dTDP-4-dehydrorhamnose 3,5-epimerase-like enzyme